MGEVLFIFWYGDNRLLKNTETIFKIYKLLLYCEKSGKALLQRMEIIQKLLQFVIKLWNKVVHDTINVTMNAHDS